MVNNRIFIGAIALLSALVIIGFITQPEDTHYCPELNISMKCDHLSSTGLRCYPQSNTTKGYKDCQTRWLVIDRTPEEQNETGVIKVQLKDGGVIDCKLEDGILKQECYYKERRHYRQEFD